MEHSSSTFDVQSLVGVAAPYIVSSSRIRLRAPTRSLT